MFSACVGECPHFESVQGSCKHDQRQLLVSYLENHRDAPCPVFENIRAREMQKLAATLELDLYFELSFNTLLLQRQFPTG